MYVLIFLVKHFLYILFSYFLIKEMTSYMYILILQHVTFSVILISQIHESSENESCSKISCSKIIIEYWQYII